MKFDIIRSIFAFSILSVAAMPAQAQTWTNGLGVALPTGTPITATGELVFTVEGFSEIETCGISVQGYVTNSNVITFYSQNPGYSCNDRFDPHFPFSLQAHVSGPLAPVKSAMAINFTIDTPLATCPPLTVPFRWYDYPQSQAKLLSTASNWCKLLPGTWLKLSGPMYGVSMN